MKLKNLFQIIGFKNKPKKYPYEIDYFTLSEDVNIQFAQWLHPRESKKLITSEMVQAYEEILKEGDFCIDIGAHTGDSTLPMALAVGKSGHVLALEPNPYVYHVLEKNARLNKSLANIETMMAAATPEEGFIEFEYSDSGFCNGGRHENISVMKHGHAFKLSVFGMNLAKELESEYKHLLPTLKFIKVDAEGYDLYILKTIKAILKKYRPYIKAEVFKNTDQQYRQDLFSLLDDMDYNLYKITEEPINKGALLSISDMNNWKHFDIFCDPR